MEKREFLLYCLDKAGVTGFTPVQIQKLLFLVDNRIGEEVGGPFYDFTPYHYGPFDSTVYHDLDDLGADGLIEVVYSGRIREYYITPEGSKMVKAFQTLPEDVAAKVDALIQFVTGNTFSALVSAIYKEYPEMKKNSVFN